MVTVQRIVVASWNCRPCATLRRWACWQGCSRGSCGPHLSQAQYLQAQYPQAQYPKAQWYTQAQCPQAYWQVKITFLLSFMVSQGLPLCPVHHLVWADFDFDLELIFSIISLIIIIIIIIIMLTNFLGPLDDAFDLIPSSIFSHTRGTPTVRVGLSVRLSDCQIARILPLF